MSCNVCRQNGMEGCGLRLKSVGVADLSRIKLDGQTSELLNWSEISVPELLPIPTEKPDIEQLDQVYVDAKITSAKLIETPYAYQVYQRAATELERQKATTAIQTAKVEVTEIEQAGEALLKLPNLPALPQLGTLQARLNAVSTASAQLDTVVSNALTLLEEDCGSAAQVQALLQQVETAVPLLEQALSAIAADLTALDVTKDNDKDNDGDNDKHAGWKEQSAKLLEAVVALNETLQTAQAALASAIALLGTTTYFALRPNEEGTYLTGRKLIVEGVLRQKVVYTGLVRDQSVHSVHKTVPFTAYIIPYAKFEGSEVQEVEVMADPEMEPCKTITIRGFAYDPQHPPVVDLCETFCVNGYVEDIFAYPVDCRTIFKNITLFLLAKPEESCG